MFILSAERDASYEALGAAWRAYEAYLVEHQNRFPPSAYGLATSDWYHDFSDDRCPHNARLESVAVEEAPHEDLHSSPRVAIRIRLRGLSGHRFELHYPQVFRYRLDLSCGCSSHHDWRLDEFRLSEDGFLLHEIEWWSSAGEAGRWLIESSDVEYRTLSPL